ncbi:MAG: hypothetical protein PWQ12_1108 [Clostridiales bacterium]|jgi:hippurate hydrolase/N-acetyldiaminopimelate deacetylase|nr:hypothetical protein [Clostridiales bacterium]
MEENLHIDALLDALRASVYAHRAELHRIPEPGNEEFKTSAYIQETLKALNIDFEVVLETGIIAYLEGSAPLRTIAFRSDIDGLSVKEAHTFEMKSQHPGYMHACGHDGHMSMLLGLAAALKHESVTLQDNVVLIFQPAEEGPGGAERIVKGGYLQKYKVDEIYGIHLFPAIEQGKIGLCSGPMMAMTGEFDIDIRSKSAHGAMPHMGIDAVVVAGECILGLQTVVSRRINPIQPGLLTIGRLEAGERCNVIAGSARMEGTMRAFNKSVYQAMKAQVYAYTDGLARAHQVEIDVTYRDMYPPVTNDPELFQYFVDLMGERCEIIEPQMISEDFSFYQEAVPGLFFFIGTRNEGLGHVAPLHSAHFNFDERALLMGLESYLTILNGRDSILWKA